VKAKWIITSWLLILGLPAPGASDRPIRPSNKPWAGVEQELLEKGIPTDTSSVVKVALTNSDEGVRWAAVELLGLRGEVSTKSSLRKILLNDSSQLVRETAALALARLKEPSGLKTLKNFMLDAEDPERQLFLATRLAELGELSGYQQIVKAATCKDEHLRFLSVESVALMLTSNRTLPKPDPADLLVQMMSDGSSEVRKEVILQLSAAFFNGVSLRPYLQNIERIAKEDPDAEVRRQAATLLISLQEFGKHRSEK
jgi:hypothetical protein